MRILFDHGTPAPLQSSLAGHTVQDAKAQGWDTFKNGDLLTAAEAAGFDVLITTDKNIRYQQTACAIGDRPVVSESPIVPREASVPPADAPISM